KDPRRPTKAPIAMRGCEPLRAELAQTHTKPTPNPVITQTVLDILRYICSVGFGPMLPFGKHQVHHPTPTNVWAVAAAVPECPHSRARILQRIRWDRHRRVVSRLVHLRGEGPPTAATSVRPIPEKTSVVASGWYAPANSLRLPFTLPAPARPIRRRVQVLGFDNNNESDDTIQ